MCGGSKMAFTINVRMKKPGIRKSRELPLVPFVLEKKPENVRELLVELTTLGVKDYNERKDTENLLAFLTQDEIAEQAKRGKVSFGSHGGKDADLEKAVVNTIQCFEDGIYRVFADEEELTNLEDKITWKEGMIFTFIRLTMLSGRI